MTVPSLWPPVRGPIAFVGEAPGREEEIHKKPFVGNSGKLLDEVCRNAGILRTESLYANVLSKRPPGNSIESLCASKREVGKEYPYPALRQGKYLRPEFLGTNLDRLREELRDYQPNVVVALGNTALWALCGRVGIGALRGSILESSLVPGLKVLPTWHPASVLRAYHQKAQLQIDLFKAKRESEFPEIRFTQREIWINPTLDDLWDFKEKFIPENCLLSVDIEGVGKVDCIGFAPDPLHALVVPFSRQGGSYWNDFASERKAWDFVRTLLEDYPCRKLGQNFYGYDMLILWHKYGIFPKSLEHDTMLLHHALHPEMEKGLGFLVSIYCNEPAYKLFRPRGRKTEKREE